MYFLRKNKAMTVRSLTAAVAALFMTSSLIFAQDYNAKNYRSLRGTTNPSEVIGDLSAADAAGMIRQMSMAIELNVFQKDALGMIYPDRRMTNLDTAKAMVHLNDPDSVSKGLNDGEYRDLAVQMGFITEDELAKPENADFFTRGTTARVFNDFFSKWLGIETRYNINKDKVITRGDFAQALYDNKEQVLAKRNIMLIQGNIGKTNSIAENGRNKTATAINLDKIYSIPLSDKQTQVDKINDSGEKKFNASYVNIVSDKDVVLLTPSGFSTDVSKLSEGSKLNIYYKDGKIIYAEPFSAVKSGMTGMLKSWNITPNTDNNPDGKKLSEAEDSKEKKNYTSTIEIVNYSGQQQKYAVHPNVKIMQANGELGSSAVSKPINADQLVFGQDVALSAVDNIVTSITAYVPAEEELNAYIPPESRMVSGVVMDSGKDFVTLTDSNTYKIGPDTLLMKNSVITQYPAMKDGDIIKIYFDELGTDLASKIEIEGSQRQADKIIKGQIGPYSVAKKGLTIKNVKQLVNGAWVPVENLEADKAANMSKYPAGAVSDTANNQFSEGGKKYQNFKLKGNIYVNSGEVAPNKLKNYMNQDIYAVLSRNQGIPTIAKANIRLGDALNYKDNVEAINLALNSFQVEGNQVTFDDSTIIVKDGNIVKPANLETNVYTDVETNLTKAAQIIVQSGSAHNIEHPERFPYKIYRGTLRDIFEDSVLLGNDIEKGRKINHFFMLDNGKWNRLSEEPTTPRLRFTQNTFIYDFDNKAVLTPDQLKEQQYNFNAFGTRPTYFNRQVYAITKDDILVALIYHSNEGYVQVNSQNIMSAYAVGQYIAQENAQNQQNNQQNQQNQQNEKPIKPLLIRNIANYNSMKNVFEPIAPITTTDPKTQTNVSTPVRKILNIDKAAVIDGGKTIPKSAVNQLKGKNITVIYKQDRSKQMDKQGDMEIINAICIIAQ